MHFSISHVGELIGQNQCASGTRNIESNMHAALAGKQIEKKTCYSSDSVSVQQNYTKIQK
jgi:hypothetical protein